MPDLLIEIGCEELPASACAEAIDQAPTLVAAALAAQRLDAGAVRPMVAPRRIAVLATDVPAERPGRTTSVRGPAESAAFRDGAPTKAAEGFARGQGVAVTDLVVREQDGRTFVFADVDEPPRPLDDVVPEVVAALVDGLRFSKTMRWGAGIGLRFSRPVRWLVAKVDDRTIPFELHGLTAGEISQGHRFLGGPVTVARAPDYEEALEGGGVIADHERRRREIVAGLDRAAREEGGSWSDPGGKLDEVLFLVERTGVVAGGFRETHLDLPEGVLVTAMQSHQRYFPVHADDGRLLPRFLTVSNGDPAHADVIRRGNEDVLDARLQDADFSVQMDRTAGLEELNGRLDRIVFHARLGTMADKRERLVAGVADLAAAVGVDPPAADAAGEAARLAKADQGAVLVAEFSELEGYVASVYAAGEGHPPEVCQAISEQYRPQGPTTPLPQSEPGALLALAERVDNLVGAFLVDEAPTGSKDPYGLRRAAAGLVRILLDRRWDVRLRPLLAAAAARLRGQGADLALDDATALDAIEAFVGERLAHHLSGEGVRAEAVAAAEGAGFGSPVATAHWAREIQSAGSGDEFGAAWTAATRLSRLAAKAPEDAGEFVSAGDPGEDALAAELDRRAPEMGRARAAGDFAAALAGAAALAPAVDTFFTDVLVNAEDPADRRRRYALVRRAADAYAALADFGAITDGGGVR